MGGGLAHPDGPPLSLRTTDFELYNYLQMIHSHIFGLGADTGDVNAFHNVGTHAQVTQGTTVADVSGAATATKISVDSADATNASEASQTTLENEVKADLNSLVTEYNVIVATVGETKTKLNALLASLRAAGGIAT